MEYAEVFVALYGAAICFVPAGVAFAVEKGWIKQVLRVK